MAIIFKDSEEIKAVAVGSLSVGDTFYRKFYGKYYLIIGIGPGPDNIKCWSFHSNREFFVKKDCQVEPVDIEVRPIR